ncbi:MAG: hypothetical protein HRU09_11415 [Oligoflexales bacterium]|nr:hypothetical protein [Oligoflexales bacterium]
MVLKTGSTIVLKETPMQFPGNIPVKGTRLYTVYYIDSSGQLHWATPSQKQEERPREAIRETFARILR